MKWNRIIVYDNQTKRKLTAWILTAAMALSVLGPFTGNAYAAAPDVAIDEATYVNLDYYGRISGVSIVKGCSLNGLTEFEDFGRYESVTNMTGYEKPALGKESVRWDLEKTSSFKRFYYNCKVKNDAIAFPWNFDISYKLNGVPCKAETLAGASGLVEIDVHVIPNDQAKDYFRNNMLLQVATYINTEDAYSIDAPGAQLQSMGTYKAVVFAALPGEEETFTIRIGSDSFETSGIMLMMIPGTLKQMEEIKSLKEAKDTIEDSAEAIYSGFDEILNTMEGMKSGIEGLKTGTQGLEDARNTFSAGKDQMREDADDVISDLSAVNQQLKNLIPYFQTGQNSIKDLNDSISDMIRTLDKLKEPASDGTASIADLQSDLKELQTMLNLLSKQMGDAMTDIWKVVKTDPNSGISSYELAKLQGVTGIVSTVSPYSSTISSLLSEAVAMGNTTINIIDVTTELIKEVDELGDILGEYEDDMVSLLGDCEQLASLMSDSLESTITYLTYSKSLLQESGDKLDGATEKSLKSMTDLLEKSLSGLASVSTLRNANSTIRNTIHEQFDKIEKENSFLKLDPNAPFVSFTSDRNPSPSSIQVILRTQEITTDQNSDKIVDLETEKEDIGFLKRLINLFKKMQSCIMPASS